MDFGQADRIRTYALKKYIEPARKEGEKTATIRSGDLHDRMMREGKLPAHRHPNVCNALGGQKLQDLANADLSGRVPPKEVQKEGANIRFTFKLKN